MGRWAAVIGAVAMIVLASLTSAQAASANASQRSSCPPKPKAWVTKIIIKRDPLLGPGWRDVTAKGFVRNRAGRPVHNLFIVVYLEAGADFGWPADVAKYIIGPHRRSSWRASSTFTVSEVRARDPFADVTDWSWPKGTPKGC